jgi:hypothetical protein
MISFWRQCFPGWMLVELGLADAVFLLARRQDEAASRHITPAGLRGTWRKERSQGGQRR